VIRVASAALCVLVGLYWLAVGTAGSRPGGDGFRVLVAIFTAVWLTAAMYPLAARRMGTAALAVLPVSAIGIGLFAAVGPWLLSHWIHADFERYVWVIRQADPCSGMGGGPGMLWVFGTSWLAAAGALTYAITFPLTATRIVGGLGLGGALLAATAAAMFPNPAVFARILGCVF
jgi:hypothetical protein